MKKWLILVGVAVALCVDAQEQEQEQEQVVVKVTGDRVSLRAEPSLVGVLLDRAKFDEELVLLDNSNVEWVGVSPPVRIDFWAHGSYVEGGTVIPARLNIRSGPSLSHPVVAIVHRGTEMTVRDETGGWVKIAPPDETVIWISRDYCVLPDGSELVAEEPVAVQEDFVQEEPPMPDKKIVETPDEDFLAPDSDATQVSDEKVFEASGEEDLIPDPDKTQAADGSFSGRLTEMDGLLCRLVDADTARVLVCYVRGNRAQMKKYAGQRVRIAGRTYWAKSLGRPIVVPTTIQSLGE